MDPPPERLNPAYWQSITTEICHPALEEPRHFKQPVLLLISELGDQSSKLTGKSVLPPSVSPLPDISSPHEAQPLPLRRGKSHSSQISFSAASVTETGYLQISADGKDLMYGPIGFIC